MERDVTSHEAVFKLKLSATKIGEMLASFWAIVWYAGLVIRNTCKRRAESVDMYWVSYSRSISQFPPRVMTRANLWWHCRYVISRAEMTGRDVTPVNSAPANWSHSPKAGFMLFQRLRRWPNINPALGERLVFAGLVWIIGYSPRGHQRSEVRASRRSVTCPLQ